MNQHLIQAIAAARAGKEAQAKVLLARVVKEEPDNVNAWYLLSSLADTEEQKIQHLEKVLELQPGHEAASQQLAELAPPMPEPAEDLVVTEEPESDATPEMFPLPEVDLAEEDTAPEDPDEAMAWLERLAADQGAPMEELPSLSEPQDDETADTLIAHLEIDFEQDYEEEDTAPEDPDEAMAWLERLAAEQGAPADELPTFFEEVDDDDLTDEDYSWLEDGDEDDSEYLESLPTLVEEETEEAAEEPEETLEESEEIAEDLEEAAEEHEEATADTAKTLTVSDDSSDIITQAEGDTIPSWLADDEELISADTLITSPVESEEKRSEPENLPDWLNELPDEDWAEDEGEKSGQVVWKAGEADDSKKPEPPAPKKKETAAPAKQTSPAKDNTNTYLAILSFLAIILIMAILYLLIVQPL